jgi:NTE family protein
MRTPWNIRIGLALGGGAARGVAHVGVLRGLVRAGIPVDVIVGTSMGAIIGGAYAATRDIDLVESQVRDVLGSEQFRKNRLSFLKETKRQRGGLMYSVGNLVRKGIVYGVSSFRTGFLSAEEIARSMATLLPDIAVEECRLPFGAVALDLDSAEEVVIRHGSLRKAAWASSAIPGLLPPLHMDGRVLIDGGWVDKVPVLPAFRLGADVVLAVDISAELADTDDYRRGVDVMFRANAIKDSVLVGFTRQLADAVVEPDVRGLHWAEFESFDRSIEEGDAAVTRALPAIRRAIRKTRLRSWLLPSLGKRMAHRLLASENMHVRVE